MKSNFSFRSLVFVSIFSLCLFFPSLNAYQELPFENPNLLISMDFQNANLKDILKIFSIQSGLNFIASEQVQERTFTLYFDKVPIKEAMDKIFKANNLAYELDPESNIFIVKDLGKAEAELVTKVFYLKYASVSSARIMAETASNLGSGGSATGATTGGEASIVTAVKKLLSKDGSVTEDSRTNSLIVQDISSRIPMIAQAVAAMDMSTPQVMLEVEMLDVSKNTVDKMGIKWPSTIASLDITGSRVTSFPFGGSKAFKDSGETLAPEETAGGWTDVTWPGKTFGPSILSIINAQLALEFLKTQTDTKYLARPRLLTLNNETAEIKITTQESVGVITSETDTTSTATVERAETGVSLRVTPQINLETGEVTMFIYPKVAEAITGTAFVSESKDFQYRDPEERSTKTLVRVKDGETVIVGGLIRNEYQRVSTKVPILGDLPLIGALFRHQGGTTTSPDKNKQRELLVFITPHIIKDKGMELAQAKQVNFPEREQGTFSAIDRQAVVKTSLNSFEKK